MAQGDPRTLHVSGAGPAGLAAALTAARAGLRVTVHEQADRVGSRFHGDFQGLESWTTRGDVLDELASIGILLDCEHTPVKELVCFEPGGREYALRSVPPLFYLVRRGSEDGSLDVGLLRQAVAAGVEVRWQEPLRKLPQGGVVAQGPRGADVVAAGWVFDTELVDGAFMLLGERFAPGGYAYLLIHRGRGTLAVCLFADFHRDHEYLERSVDFFARRVGVRMSNARRFGGAGSFRLPDSALHGGLLFAGEAAGFQDPLWGFGLRYALLSGHLAAQAWATGLPGEYDKRWRRRFAGQIRAGVVNRFLYARFGDPGLRLFARRIARAQEPRDWLRRKYAPSWWKDMLSPFVRNAVVRRPDPAECPLEGCDCTRCRCMRGMPETPRPEAAVWGSGR